jgi:hypothetical protein
VAGIALKSIYPNASLELIDQLTRAMRETYALFRQRQARQEQLQVSRVQSRTPLPLSTTDEEPVMMPRPMHQPSPIREWPNSEPTSLDSQEVKAKLRQKRSSSEKSGPDSIHISQVDYPRSSKESMTCEWCFSPLPKDAFEGEKWTYETPHFLVGMLEFF